jgi:hypothetical protein
MSSEDPSFRGGTRVYGLRFSAGGRKEGILPGLNYPQADMILSAMQAFGASHAAEHPPPKDV